MTATEPRPSDPRLAISRTAFRQISDLILREVGIRMPESKISLLQSRLQRRMRALGYESLEPYLEAVLSGPAGDPEVLEFIDAITTNKTEFLREPRHFDYLRDVALPELEPDSAAPWRANVWSAGCSSGEEVYSLAMVLGEFAATRSGFEFSVVGTDISRRVLQAAEAGIYDQEAIAPVPMPWRTKYLLRNRDPHHPLVKVGPELRNRVRFERLNFMDEAYELRDTFDVIFFRNVMIYFDRPTQEKVVNRLCERLRPGGYLFTGHSESLLGITAPLQVVSAAVYRRS